MNLVGQEIVQHLTIAVSADIEGKNNTVVKWLNSEDQLPGFANPPPTPTIGFPSVGAKVYRGLSQKNCIVDNEQ